MKINIADDDVCKYRCQWCTKYKEKKFRISDQKTPLHIECPITRNCPVRLNTLFCRAGHIYAFYSQLKATLSSVPRTDVIIVLGDFNARVGSDKTTWHGVLGNQGRGNLNANGELLLQLCKEFNLSITNTFFDVPDKHFYSWKHPRSGHWHLLDYILVSRSVLKDVCLTRAMRGAECSTDHLLIRCRLKVTIHQPRKRTAPKSQKKLDIKKLGDGSKGTDFQTAFCENYSMPPDNDVDAKWHHYKDCLYTEAEKALGHPKRKDADWFNDCNGEITELVGPKHKALQAHLSKPHCSKTKAIFTKVYVYAINDRYTLTCPSNLWPHSLCFTRRRWRSSRRSTQKCHNTRSPDHWPSSLRSFRNTKRLGKFPYTTFTQHPV